MDLDLDNLFDPWFFFLSKVILPHELVLHCLAFSDVSSLLVARRMSRFIETKTRDRVEGMLLQKFGSLGILCEIAPATFLVRWVDQHPAWRGIPFYSQLGLSGRVDTFQLILETQLRKIKARSRMLVGAIGNACLRGHLACVQFLVSQGVALHDGCWMAAEYGHMDVVRFLHAHRCPFYANSLAQAACFGQLDAVEFLIEHGYADSRADVEMAIRRTKDPEILGALKAQLAWLRHWDMLRLVGVPRASGS